MTEPDDAEEFYALAMKEIAERSTPEETLNLKHMVLARPDLAEELHRLRDEVPIVKEVLMLLNAAEATEGEIPEYALERLRTKVRRTYSQRKIKGGFRERFWWLRLKAGAFAALLLLAVLAGYRFMFVHEPGSLHENLTYATGIEERFKTEHITQTFIQRVPLVASTHGNVLEIGTFQSEEVFARSDSPSFLGFLGATTSEIRVPVTYRYHILLTGRWRLSTDGNVCVVVAPSLRPSLPPAIDTDRMETRTEGSWLRFNAQENLRALEKTISPILSERAADARHITLVREIGRMSVAEFIRSWLLIEDHWREGRFTAIVIVFEDEVVAGNSGEKRRDPTLKM